VPDQVTVNDVGDVVLEDAAQLRALADQDRLAVFTTLQRHGPADRPEAARQVRILAHFLPGDGA
jgi:hypothetical protein